MTDAIENGGLSEERQVVYDLFAASFGQRSADARLALLMMALESLIKPTSRPVDSRRHIQGMIEATERSGLVKSEIDSIKGALSWLLNESIGQAGRRLAKTLEPRRYKDEAPAAFFAHCYEMRSRLMHGLHPLPTSSEVDSWAAPLEVFVADLLPEQAATRGARDSENDSTGPRTYAKLFSWIIRHLSERVGKLKRR